MQSYITTTTPRNPALAAGSPLGIYTPLTAQELYVAGFEGYCAGLSLADMPDNASMKKGWQSANRAQGECETPGYAESMGY